MAILNQIRVSISFSIEDANPQYELQHYLLHSQPYFWCYFVTLSLFASLNFFFWNDQKQTGRRKEKTKQNEIVSSGTILIKQNSPKGLTEENGVTLVEKGNLSVRLNKKKIF